MELTLKRSLFLLIAVSLAVGLAGRADVASQKTCTADEEKHALDEADRLKDWNDVYRSFKRYRHCDDGAIAEGYSDTVGRLLAHDWEHVDDMFHLTATDNAFKRFVLRHINETSPPDELKTIANNATLRCPSRKNFFCRQIVARSFPSNPAALSQSSPPHVGGLWFWFGDCPSGKMMGVQVLLEGKTIFHSHFRACLMDRTDANTEREQKIKASFHFSGGYTFQGMYHTRKAETIEGTIWQAGADPDAILLGVSFLTNDQVLLNTIHISKPGKTTQSQLDRDLVIKTYPVRSTAVPSADR